MGKYYALQLCSLIYKALSALTVLFVLGAIGFMAAGAATPRGFDMPGWLAQALPLLVGGGLLAFTFFVLAQLIDLQTANTRNMYDMTAELKDLHETLEKHKQTDHLITVAIERQNRLLTILAREKDATGNLTAELRNKPLLEDEESLKGRAR